MLLSILLLLLTSSVHLFGVGHAVLWVLPRASLTYVMFSLFAVKDTFVQVRALFDEIKSLFSKLATTFNLSEYYRLGWSFCCKSLASRFHGLWRNVTQNLVFNASLLVYLESEKLITLEEFQELVGGNELHGRLCSAQD